MSDPASDERKPDADSGDKKGEEDQDSRNEQAASVDIGALDTYTTLRLFLSILAAQAWRRMGLVVDSKTNKVDKDMEQAKAAIDCFQLILKQIESKLSEDEKRKMNSVLSDLQLNFVTHQ